MNKLSERIIVCQDCKNKFITDSPHHDAYCGYCRIEYMLWQKKNKLTDNDLKGVL